MPPSPIQSIMIVRVSLIQSEREALMILRALQLAQEFLDEYLSLRNQGKGHTALLRYGAWLDNRRLNVQERLSQLRAA